MENQNFIDQNRTLQEEIGKRAEQIYRSKFQKLEQTERGKFLTININTEEGFVDETIEESLAQAKSASQKNGGIFFTIKIGYPETISYSKQSNLVSCPSL